MLLPASTERVPRLLQLASVASTNAELVRLAGTGALPGFTTLVSDDQTAGRGRRGRSWSAPAGSSLAISVLLRPLGPDGAPLTADLFSWLPLAAGVAMTDAVAAVLRAPDGSGTGPATAAAGFKWPNDVQLGGRKVCGVLGELLPSGDGVVMGAGVNTTMTIEQLPVPTATSLAIEGAAGDDLADRVLSAYLARLVELVEAYGVHGGDAEASGLRAAAVRRCTTIGREVRAELPGDAELSGSAVGIDVLGRLEVRTGSGRVEAIAAGDIIHLR
jgi:BirA family biotin operon repressor/biotin-[acetyl-CoA-carboxylase] ligase